MTIDNKDWSLSLGGQGVGRSTVSVLMSSVRPSVFDQLGILAFMKISEGTLRFLKVSEWP